MARADPRTDELLGDAERPYDVRPERLYIRDDLMAGWHRGADHSKTLDGRIYAYVRAHGGRAPDMDEGLAQRTHDHFIDVALAKFLMRTGRLVVGIMGGSSTVAADPNYRRVVRLTAELSRGGYLVVGGGGLGIRKPPARRARFGLCSRSQRVFDRLFELERSSLRSGALELPDAEPRRQHLHGALVHHAVVFLVHRAEFFEQRVGSSEEASGVLVGASRGRK